MHRPRQTWPVVEASKDADVVLLVTEPTPFGLNDLKLAVETMRELGKPIAVVINRSGNSRHLRQGRYRQDLDHRLLLGARRG